MILILVGTVASGLLGFAVATLLGIGAWLDQVMDSQLTAFTFTAAVLAIVDRARP